MSLSPAFLDELRARTLLSSLVGKSVKLTKAGREFKGCCPFHNEKTPSFYVNDDKGFYHCFGCSAHGDAIRWMTDNQGLPFIEAVKELAASAGMAMPAPDPRAAERQARDDTLYDVMAAATAWFADQLYAEGGAAARAYLLKRAITPPLAKAFGLGLAPDTRGGLKAALARFGEGKLIEAGLLILVEGKESYDRFRGRLMIPIKDARGRVIAFGGRILGAGEPKYLNSPDTPLFDKGRTLYNLDRAGPAARKAGRIVVVEGYMDVIALAKAGIDEAIAPLGTALTEDQMARLWRLSPAPILCFDGDSAGQKAAVRAAQRALPLVGPAQTLSFVGLPKGVDPDDLVRDGGRNAIEALLAQPTPLVDHVWAHHRDALPLSTPEARAGLKRRLNEAAAVIADPDTRTQYQSEFRQRFAVMMAPAPTAPRAAMPRGGANWGRGFVPERPPGARARGISHAGVDTLYVRAALAGLMRYPDLILPLAESVAQLVTSDSALERLRRLMLGAAYDHPALDSDTLMAICVADDFGILRNALGDATGPSFSFTSTRADPDLARRDLTLMIETLAQRPGAARALAEATQRLATTGSVDDLADQQQCRLALQRADDALAALASGDNEVSDESVT